MNESEYLVAVQVAALTDERDQWKREAQRQTVQWRIEHSARKNVEAELHAAYEKIKAAPHQFPQCFRFLCNEDDLTYPCTCWKQMP